MFELTVRIIFSLLVVLGLMWGLARLARRPLSIRRGGMVAVLGRQQLSKGASVAVVRVVDRAMVLGITDSQVTLLAETDLATVENFHPEPQVLREAVSLDELSSLDPTGDPTGEEAQARPSVVAAPSPFAGSLLSPETWRQVARFLRERVWSRPGRPGRRS